MDFEPPDLLGFMREWLSKKSRRCVFFVEKVVLTNHGEMFVGLFSMWYAGRLHDFFA